jgi:hypothetical protein
MLQRAGLRFSAIFPEIFPAIFLAIDPLSHASQQHLR